MAIFLEIRVELTNTKKARILLPKSILTTMYYFKRIFCHFSISSNLIPNVDHPKGGNMDKLYLLLIVLVPALSLYMAVMAKVTMPEPVAMLLFGTFLVSFANLKFSKEKQ